MTALLLATASERESSVDCVHALLEAGADADARQPLTLAGPLHLACLSSIRGGPRCNAVCLTRYVMPPIPRLLTKRRG